MNLKNKKVLITGATGGIGNNLVKKFNDLIELKTSLEGPRELREWNEAIASVLKH